MGDVATKMAQEIHEAPGVIDRQAEKLAQPLGELVARLERQPPQLIVTCARGSSAHAATLGKHLIELYLGIPVVPAAPSIVSIYNRPLVLNDQLFLAISQSGQSDDLIAMARSAKAGGAITVAMTNAVNSPLSTSCDHVIPICAGPELSIAATKTFVATAAALARLVAAWARNEALTSALRRLPERLAGAAALDWTAALPVLADAASLVTIGRGPTLGIAREAALKLKEVCNRHAEAFSGAEFLHGPVALVSFRYPVVMFMPTDAAANGMQRLASNLRQKGTALFVAGPPERAPGQLPVLPADQPEADAICLIQSFYVLAVQLAESLQIDVDRPRHLSKITSTT